jgi:hypothetical protein
MEFDMTEIVKVCGSTGDRNQCPSCGELFKSSRAFTKHRHGEIGVDRRCMTAEEMAGKGMLKNDKGFWITEAYLQGLHKARFAAGSAPDVPT